MMRESRTNKLVKNITSALFAKVLVLILGLVSRTIFLRYLSVDYLGVNGLFTNVLTILSFAELGIGNAIQFHMYKPIKEQDHKKSLGLLLLYKKSYYMVFGIVLFSGMIIAPFIHYLVNSPPNITEDMRLIFVLYVFNTAVSYLFIYKQTVLIADQNAYMINIASSITTILSNLIHIVILIITSNYVLYLISTTICTLLMNGTLSFYIGKKYKWIKTTKKMKIDKNYRNKIFKDVRDLTVSKIAGIACNGTDNIIISKMISITAVGLVSNYMLVINSASGIINTAINSLTGSIGNFNTDATTERKYQVFHEIFLVNYLVYGFVCIGLLVLINSFIELMWGEEFILSFPTVFFLVFIVFQSGLNYPAYTFRVTMGYFEKMKYVYIFTAIINIGLSIALSIPFRLAGIYAATIISKALTSELGDGYYAYKYGCGKNLKEYVVMYVRYLICAIITCACTFVVTNIVYGTGVVSFLLKGVVASVIIIVCDIFFFGNTEAFRGLMKRITRR